MYRRRIKNAKKTLTEKLKIDQILMIFDSLLICVHRKERGGIMMEVCLPFRCEKLYLLQPKLIKNLC